MRKKWLIWTTCLQMYICAQAEGEFQVKVSEADEPMQTGDTNRQLR